MKCALPGKRHVVLVRPTTCEVFLFFKREETIVMKKNIISIIIILISLATTVSCGKRLASNPSAAASYADIPGILLVTSIDPRNGTIDVPVYEPITASFSSNIDSTSVSLSSFIVADSLFIPVDGDYSYPDFPDTRTIVFTPSALLTNLTEYNVLLTPDITDIAGNRLISEKIWYFTTVSAGTTIQDPVFTPACGIYEGPQVVSITCLDPGATIRYTTDGSDPSQSSGTKYTAPLHINVNTPHQIKARAYRTGFEESSVVSAGYTIQAYTPTIDPPAGTYSADTIVTLSTQTAGAAIKYTLDLSDPEINPAAFDYAGPFTVTGPGTTTVRAVALSPSLSQLANSPILQAVYSINYSLVAPPGFNPGPGKYINDPWITISSTTPGSHIKYTAVTGTVGSDPYVFGMEGGPDVSLKITETITITAYAYDPAALLGDSLVSTGVYLVPPVINSMTPKKGPNYQPITVTITGDHFKTGVDVKLKRNNEADIVADSQSIVLTGNTIITCILDITGRTKGKWSLVVTNDDAGTTEKNEFRIY